MATDAQKQRDDHEDENVNIEFSLSLRASVAIFRLYEPSRAVVLAGSLAKRVRERIPHFTVRKRTG